MPKERAMSCATPIGRGRRLREPNRRAQIATVSMSTPRLSELTGSDNIIAVTRRSQKEGLS
jgi:hypothetical protein